MVFQVPPGILDGIELRGVGRELEEMDSGVLFFPAENLLSPMSAKAIPDHKDLAPGKVELELLQESHAFDAAHVLTWVKPEEEASTAARCRRCDSADRGDFLMRARLSLEDRSFSAGRPRPSHHRGELEG